MQPSNLNTMVTTVQWYRRNLGPPTGPTILISHGCGKVKFYKNKFLPTKFSYIRKLVCMNVLLIK